MEWVAHLREANKAQCARACRKNALLHHRYKICGETRHLPDRPVVADLSPWTGQSDKTMAFTVQPRQDSNINWPPEKLFRITIKFADVDSPAAWAAQKYGCQLLRGWGSPETQVLAGLAGSGDAVCSLLDQQCPADKLCPLIDQQGLGGAGRDVKPSLAPAAIVQAMLCMSQTQVCSNNYTWTYDPAARRLRINNRIAAVPVTTLLSKVFTSSRGFQFLKEVLHRTTNRLLFLEALAQAVWTLGTAQLIPALTALVALTTEMPELLLQAFVTSTTFSGFDDMSSRDAVRELFDGTRKLKLKLQDAAQLDKVTWPTKVTCATLL